MPREKSKKKTTVGEIMTVREMKATSIEDLKVDIENLRMAARVVKRKGGKGAGPKYIGLMNKIVRIHKHIKARQV